MPLAHYDITIVIYMFAYINVASIIVNRNAHVALPCQKIFLKATF